MALRKALLKGCSLSALFIAATWMSGCADDSAPPGTTPDSGPALDVAGDSKLDTHSDSKLDSHSDDGDAPGLDASPDHADSSQCVAPRVLLYNTAGCGGAAPAPICLGVGDACAGTYCDCEGVTMHDWCEGAKRPFVRRGACTDGGDASPDSDATNPDVDPSDVADASDADGADSDSGYVDAPACADDASLVYDKAGCGAQTPAPVCRSGGDACASIFCSCDGSTFIDACNWAAKPFAHFGACPDAPANWDAARDVVDNF
jgi:hypothetical protein